ncbi:MAG: 16S rRNA (cytosine(1402)-N(4))-methyltransferase RsmH [Patescibacteria group bacterium]|nr:16S rRNA (cytosine(1402)-N(4))-methyltransferase RsmH [Patescibacteria group bacterium]MCL5258126.1 16S rRNA (cytosine(1402)-N(4))-methyltransferase RsmH [Patescibacteria group bacterium]
MFHQPVLLEEVIYFLKPKDGDCFIDATFGFGGHSLALAERIGQTGRILGLEWDPVVINQINQMLQNNNDGKKIRVINKNFRHIKEIVKTESFTNIQGVIFDLGFSSFDLENSGRGFSFQKDEPLDMRYNPEAVKLTAFDLVNYSTKEELVEVLENYGEEEEAERVARKIIEVRKTKKIESSKELSQVIFEAKKRKSRKINPATKTFMALRMFINQELENLRIGLTDSYDLLASGGRIVIISFNGLEDKTIKSVFKDLKKQDGRVVTKHVIKPSQAELKTNRRSRSARLRVLEKNNEQK